ncbi:MAG: phospholipase [Myxococcota bacterium]|nr:phospholipase [Myxococcota bacterium]
MDALPEAYAQRLAAVGAQTLGTLEAFETVQRRLHPPLLGRLRQGLALARDRLEEAVEAFREAEVPDGLDAFHGQLGEGAELVLEALALFSDPGPPEQAVARVLGSMRRVCRAQERLYPLRLALPPLARHFVEPAFHGRLAALDPEPPAGVSVGLHAAGGDDPDGRGGFSLYVPEWYDGREPWPLVVALHGGSGHGRDFLWTWLREARGRGFLLLSPTSHGGTWSLDAPERDARRLVSMLEFVAERWPVDRERILLTGLSDGATFALLAGLAEDAPYTALAPVSGVLHPTCIARGDVARAAGRRIYLVHGALDWMFPVGLARAAAGELERAGAELVFREIEDLSHTYPRDENDRILSWFDPALALPDG